MVDVDVIAALRQICDLQWLTYAVVLFACFYRSF